MKSIWNKDEDFVETLTGMACKLALGWDLATPSIESLDDERALLCMLFSSYLYYTEFSPCRNITQCLRCITTILLTLSPLIPVRSCLFPLVHAHCHSFLLILAHSCSFLLTPTHSRSFPLVLAHSSFLLTGLPFITF